MIGSCEQSHDVLNCPTRCAKSRNGGGKIGTPMQIMCDFISNSQIFLLALPIALPPFFRVMFPKEEVEVVKEEQVLLMHLKR